MADSLHDAIEARLEQAGNRYTRGRRRLIEVLLEAGRPLTVRELLERGERLSTSSVYRNLGVLEASRVLRQIPSVGDDGVRVELHEDLAGQHHHLDCSSCGQLIDIVLPAEVELALSRACRAVQRATGFRADGHRLELFGMCRSCQ